MELHDLGLPPLENRPPDGEPALRVRARYEPRRFEIEDERGRVHGRLLDSGDADVCAVVHDMRWLCGVRRTRWSWSGVVFEQPSDRLVARYAPRFLGGGTIVIRDQPYTLRKATSGRGWRLQDVEKGLVWTMRPLTAKSRSTDRDDGDPLVSEVALGPSGQRNENLLFTILLGVWITDLEEEARHRSRPGPGPNV